MAIWLYGAFPMEHGYGVFRDKDGGEGELCCTFYDTAHRSAKSAAAEHAAWHNLQAGRMEPR